jgi:AbrB family looped-hinge helix DNA binding protein
MTSWNVNVAENGRLCLPAELRRALGLERGGPVTLELEDGQVRLLTVAARVRRAQELTRQAFAGKRMPTVDEFIAWKREQAALEAAKIDRLAASIGKSDDSSR